MRLVGLLLLAGLGACTATVTPAPSPAVLEARAAAAERIRRANEPAPCVDPRSYAFADATVIRFQFMTADLEDLGSRDLRRAVEFARCDAATAIVLVAEADRRGTPAAEAALAAQRVEVMRKAMTDAGVAAGRITTAVSRANAPAGSLALLGRNLGG